jgi:hypothetical protein
MKIILRRPLGPSTTIRWAGNIWIVHARPRATASSFIFRYPVIVALLRPERGDLAKIVRYLDRLQNANGNVKSVVGGLSSMNWRRPRFTIMDWQLSAGQGKYMVYLRVLIVGSETWIKLRPTSSDACVPSTTIRWE